MHVHAAQPSGEDEFLSERDLVDDARAASSLTAPHELAGHRSAYPARYVVMTVGILLGGVVGFVVAEYSQESKPEILVVQNTSTPPSAEASIDAIPPRTAPAERIPKAITAGVPDLTGWWNVTNRVESAAYQPFAELNLGYRLLLTQTGNQITGTGYQWMENGQQLPPSQRTAIAVNGTIEGRQVTLQFFERGPRRTSTGAFTYEITETDVLHGTFTTDVAESKGSTQARRTRPSPES